MINVLSEEMTYTRKSIEYDIFKYTVLNPLDVVQNDTTLPAPQHYSSFDKLIIGDEKEP